MGNSPVHTQTKIWTLKTTAETTQDVSNVQQNINKCPRKTKDEIVKSVNCNKIYPMN